LICCHGRTVAGGEALVYGNAFEELFFSIDERIDVVSCELKTVTVSNRVRRAGLHTIPAENTPGVVDIVDTRIAFGGRDSLSLSILGGFDINTLRGTGCGAKETADTFLQAVFITMKDMDPAITRLKMDRFVRVILGGRFTPKVAERDAESLYQGCEGAANLFQYRRHAARV